MFSKAPNILTRVVLILLMAASWHTYTTFTCLLVTKVVQGTYRAAGTHLASLRTKAVGTGGTVVTPAAHNIGLAVTLTTQGTANAALTSSAITLTS